MKVHAGRCPCTAIGAGLRVIRIRNADYAPSRFAGYLRDRAVIAHVEVITNIHVSNITNKVIKPGESVQCWNENLMRGGLKDPGCK